MENYQILDKIMLVFALLILGGGFFILFQGVFAMGKDNKNK
jgi:hypothetical protein